MPHVTLPSHQADTTMQSNGSIPASLWKHFDDSILGREDRLIQFRRRIHAAPEASGVEKATSALVAETLRENGIEARILADGVGVIGDIDLGAESQTFVALRSELDCVQVNDDKQVEYASTRPGLCHACGHDMHTTMVLAAAIAVAEQREQLADVSFRHNLRFVFQPAEETAEGARSMIRQGVIDGVDAILAVHVDPTLDVGQIGLRKGPLTSACKTFRLKLRGRSGHSARPYEAVDPIPAAVNIVSLWYQLCPRTIDSRSPLSLTVASISSGSSSNAIPDEALVQGTLRTTMVEDTDTVQRQMQKIVDSVSQMTGCHAEMDFLRYSPPTDNDGRLVDIMAEVAEDITGPDRIRWVEKPSLGAEDFGFYQRVVPGALARLGVGFLDGRQSRPLHSSMFDVDESALAIGARFLGRTALRVAANPPGRLA